MNLDLLQYYLYMGEDETQWPDDLSPIVRMTVIEQEPYPVRVLSVTIDDQIGLIGKRFTLEDGMLIKAAWAFGGESKTQKFRLVAPERVSMGNYYRYRLLAWAEEVAWFVDTSNKSYSGNSSDAIKQIAEEAGLQYEGDDTADKQIWYGMARKRYVAARMIAQHGWASDNSLMRLGRRDDVLLYKDINAIDVSKAVAFLTASDLDNSGSNLPVFPIINHNFESLSGTNNLRGGYKSTKINQSVTEADNDKSSDKVSVKDTGLQLQQNSKIVGQMQTGLITTGRASSPNTHANYSSAQYQNSRAWNLVSELLRVNIPFQTSVNMFDPVTVKLSQSNRGAIGSTNDETTQYDGNYLSVGKIVQMVNSHYNELHLLRRAGLQL